MEIKIVKKEIPLEEVKKIAKEQYGDMVKAVVDIEKEIMAIGGEFHSDAYELLIEAGCSQKNIWGINIYPDKPKENSLEFNSLINIRPAADNLSMEIEKKEIREKIKQIIDKLIL